MPALQFKWDISLGNTLSILTVIVAVAVAWASLNSRVIALEEVKDEVAQRVKRLEDERDRTARIEEKLVFIQQTLQRLETALDRRNQAKLAD